MILNHAEAEAIYSAMCALNNVGTKQITVNLDGKGTRVIANEKRGVTVVLGYLQRQQVEEYANQAAFAAAYKLQ